MRLYAGDYAQAVATLKAAMRINPNFKPWVTYNLSVASLSAGDLGTALTLAQAYVDADAGDPYAHINLALALTANDRAGAAPACIADMRERFDDVTAADYVACHRFRDRQWLARLVEWLRAAGLR
jgi:Flp pilus assembly protein TadD